MTLVNTSNRLALDYEKEAGTFARLDYPIIDAHSHITGDEASRLYGRAAQMYGVGLTYSMTPFEQLDVVKANLGDRVRFIAMPTFNAKDPLHAMGRGFIDQLPTFWDKGARMVKFWSAPRGVDLGTKAGQPDLLQINAPHRIEIMKIAHDMGFIFMAHVGDPDTWFRTKYANESVYGSKRTQYDRFEEVLQKFPTTWIGAHMGGWPEDLEFLSDLLTRYPYLYLDASATKWMVRELSKHSVADLHEFLNRWTGRILFGSDIITSDDHFKSDADNEMGKKASSQAEAFDLYASRYWALRKLWETTYEGESPIADPDLNLVEPTVYSDTDAPPLKGKNLTPAMVKMLYHDAAHTLLEKVYAK